jgi:hypothetical protein
MYKQPRDNILDKRARIIEIDKISEIFPETLPNGEVRVTCLRSGEPGKVAMAKHLTCIGVKEKCKCVTRPSRGDA